MWSFSVRIGISTRWALHLTVEDDQLLTEERVFGNEFCPGAGQISERSAEVRVIGWPRPLEQTLIALTNAASERAHERAQ
jgi:hypothetical protein